MRTAGHRRASLDRQQTFSQRGDGHHWDTVSALASNESLIDRVLLMVSLGHDVRQASITSAVALGRA